MFASASNIGSLDAGDWVKYGRVDFGAGVSSFTARITVPASVAGKWSEIRAGGPTGTLLGVLTTVATGGWAGFSDPRTAITAMAGA